MNDDRLNIKKEEVFAYVIFVLTSFILIGFFLNMGKGEGYITSTIKWAFFELSFTINVIFIIASILRFYLKKRITKIELILTIMGVFPMLTLWVFTKFTY